MTSFRIRPRFRLTVPTPEEALAAQIKARLSSAAQPPCTASITKGYIVLSIPMAQQHYWSPQLSLSIEPCEEGTLIRGLYGPNPTIWAMFAFGYGILAMLCMFAAILGFSAQALGQPAGILWLIPATVVTAGIMYLIAQTGQKLGAEQTYALHHFFEEAIGGRAEIQ